MNDDLFGQFMFAVAMAGDKEDAIDMMKGVTFVPAEVTLLRRDGVDVGFVPGEGWFRDDVKIFDMEGCPVGGSA